MPAFSAAQLALAHLLRQRLAAAGCWRGRFDVSEPGLTLSLSGEKADGKTLFFWEFGHAFYELVDAYLAEQYDAHTARLTLHVDVQSEQAQLVRTPKPTPAGAAPQPGSPPPPTPDRVPYGPTLAAQVAARLDQGARLAGGWGLARGPQRAYHYGQHRGAALVPTATFATWAAFVAWLASQSDYSLADKELTTSAAEAEASPLLTRQRLLAFVQAP